jgi:hypothetical protein
VAADSNRRALARKPPREKKEGKQFFFEKKNQKTFTPKARVAASDGMFFLLKRR